MSIVVYVIGARGEANKAAASSTQDKRFSELPCQVSALEPKVQGGSQFVTVGFSVRAEPAQKQQEGAPKVKQLSAQGHLPNH